MATSQQQLAFAIRAVNEASATLKQVQGDIDGVSGAAEKSRNPLGGMGSALGNVVSIAGGFVLANGIMQAPGFFLDAAKAAAEDEAATMRLDQSVKNYTDTLDDSDQAHKEIMGDIEERIAAGQKLAFSDDSIRDSLQTLLAATGDYGEATQRQAAAMDLARAKNISLEQASTLLAKANDENVNVLRRMGITLKEGATETELLATVQQKFGGQAETFAKSNAGMYEQWKIRQGEIIEQIGGFVLPLLTKLGGIFIEQIVPRVEAGVSAIGPIITRIAEWVQQNVLPQLQLLGDFFIKVIAPAIAQFMGRVQEEFAKFGPYYDENIKPILEGFMHTIGEVISWVVEHWPEIQAAIQPVIETIGIIIETTFKTAKNLIDLIIQLLKGDFAGAWRAVGRIVEDVWEGITGIIRIQVNRIIDIINVLIRGWNGLNFNVGIPGTDLNINVGTPDIPLIPKLAAGGIVTRPTIALLGEAGPEAVVPLSRGGFGGVVVNINGLVAGDPVEIGRQIARYINQATIHNGPMLDAGSVAA